MKIKQDPVTCLWAREDGAVLMPPCRKFPYFRWTFGSKHYDGYRHVRHQGKVYMVHLLVCRAFHGLPPVDKPFCDHKSRVKSENFASNLHWVSCKENAANQDCVDQGLEKHGVRECEDKKAYNKAYGAAHREELRAYMRTFNAKKKAQGLTYRKGANGKHGWYPRINL